MPARGLHRAAAVAMDAAALGGVETPRAAACAAPLLTRDGDVALAAADGFLEGERDRLMQIGAARSLLALPRLALLQHVSEQIAEGRRRGAAHRDREIEPLEPKRARFGRLRRR